MRLATVLILMMCSVAAALTPVEVKSFEKEVLPKVWLVDLPVDAVTARLSNGHKARTCLSVDYRFTGGGQYLGVVNPVRILAPIHRLHFWMAGDSSFVGLAVYLNDVSGETHKYRFASPKTTEWTEVTVDLDKPHESWGGDKNGKLDLPVLGITFEVANAGSTPCIGTLKFDSLSVDSEKSALETLGVTIAVRSPAYGADVHGDTRIDVAAPKLDEVTATCWQQGGRFGHLATVATTKLDAHGNGSFIFPADQFPHGPITVQISGHAESVSDNCYLQLYNTGGVRWNDGLPKAAPPAAAGMTCIFADDFDRPPSISSTDHTATYFDHKPLGGDFSSLPFTGFAERGNPFLQRDTYLRIRADSKQNSAGLLSSEYSDGHGIKACAPCYFECRFLGPNAIGTWPAFWLLTDYPSERKNGKAESQVPVDELDIIEAYGGEGLGSPNAFDRYCITPHAWNQPKAAVATADAAWKNLHSPISMNRVGIPSTWYQTFHTYGCKITAADTIYYCDDIEIGRHATLDISKYSPMFFLINLATGGGWPVDLSRYDGRADMYVDYVRVYQGKRR